MSMSSSKERALALSSVSTLRPARVLCLLNRLVIAAAPPADRCWNNRPAESMRNCASRHVRTLHVPAGLTNKQLAGSERQRLERHDVHKCRNKQKNRGSETIATDLQWQRARRKRCCWLAA
jgi:hypothetical protein